MANRGPEMMDGMLRQIQGVVDGLKIKSDACANLAVQSSTVTDKLAVMKEYNQEVSVVNHVRAPDGRNNLVASLQQESRQIQALQEENRQMEYTIQSMQDGMDFLMSKHREVVDGMHCSDRMIDLLDKLELVPPGDRNAHIGQLANLTRDVINRAEQKECMYNKALAQLKMENKTLRQLLTSSRMSDYILQTGKHSGGKSRCTECRENRPITLVDASTQTFTEQSRCYSSSSSDSALSVIQFSGNTADPIFLPPEFVENLLNSCEDEEDERMLANPTVFSTATFTVNPDYVFATVSDSPCNSRRSSFSASVSQYIAFPHFNDFDVDANKSTFDPDEYLKSVSTIEDAPFNEKSCEQESTVSEDLSETAAVIESMLIYCSENQERFIPSASDKLLDVDSINNNYNNNSVAYCDNKKFKSDAVLTNSESSDSTVVNSTHHCFDDDFTEDAYIGFVNLFALNRHALTLSSHFGCS